MPGNVELIVPAKFSIRCHDSNGIRLSKQRDPITVTDRFGHREVSVRYHEPSGKLDCSFPQFVAVIAKRSHDAAEATSGAGDNEPVREQFRPMRPNPENRPGPPVAKTFAVLYS